MEDRKKGSRRQATGGLEGGRKGGKKGGKERKEEGRLKCGGCHVNRTPSKHNGFEVNQYQWDFPRILIIFVFLSCLEETVLYPALLDTKQSHSFQATTNKTNFKFFGELDYFSDYFPPSFWRGRVLCSFILPSTPNSSHNTSPTATESEI